MVLDSLDDGAKRLVLVLCLPLVDGVFATLLVTGAVETFSDIVAVALTVFTGAGSIAVLYAHAESVAEARRTVRRAAPFLVGGAVAVAVVAPVFEQLFHVHRLRYAAGIALLVIAAQLVEIDLADTFTVPGIILTGFALSVRQPDALRLTATYVAPAIGTALVAVAGLYLAASIDRSRMTLAYVRRGGAAALAIIALSLFGVRLPTELGLVVLAASLLVSVHPRA